MAKLTQPLDQATAWALACAAYRINNGYIKFATESNKKNTELIYDIFDNQETLLADADREQGQQVRDYIAKTATMATLRGTLDTWGQEMARVAQLEQVEQSFDLHVIASMPQTYARYVEREKVQDRLSQTVEAVGLALKDKVELAVEVLTSRWSQNWATYYVTVVDKQNRAWFFAHRRNLAQGSQVVIRGTVKRFADRMVQLNRVRIEEKE